MMDLKLSKEEGIVILSPVTSKDTTFLRNFADSVGEGGLLKYSGREGADCYAPYSERMRLNFELGGCELVLVASSDESEPVIRNLRDAIYFGGSGLYVVAICLDDAADKKSVHVCVCHCSHCGAPLVEMVSTEWKTCKKCAAKCEHHYVHGAVHGGDAGELDSGFYCKKCGRAKPNDELSVVVLSGVDSAEPHPLS